MTHSSYHQTNGAGPTSGVISEQLKVLFGEQAYITPFVTAERMGRRVHGVDLQQPLNPEQAAFVVALLDDFNIVSFPDQRQKTFLLRHMERLANHFGAPLPHPKNYANYGKPDQELRLVELAKRTSTRSNQAFPNLIRCKPDADNPAVYIVSNLVSSNSKQQEMISGGQHWHTDIEFERIPLSTSMFFVQCVPTRRDPNHGSWVCNPPREPGFYHPDSASELAQRREALPCNGETAFTDTAAAFADLPDARQKQLCRIQIRRRFRRSDSGWLTPLVHTNPRNGKKSLHSPVWASRGKNIAPALVDGMSEEASRAFLDELETHVLQPIFRYDHEHRPGDVTIWNNFATLHTAPPYKSVINHPDDARLMYRISCKGEPSYTLPRLDSDDWIAKNISPAYRTPLT